ncbi:MAG TPA: SBBP repeat-containing protein [Candidatus Bathyarchaeia archaeon]|nr:SBBP repeat-containing protein [Candidatus Bathyarchaeia archaeon]
MCKLLNTISSKRVVLLFLIILLAFLPYSLVLSLEQETGTDHFLTLNTNSPSLSYSSFLGGNNIDGASSIALASDGSYYLTGGTSSSDFPTLNAFNSTYGGNNDAFLAKFSASDSLLWSTYLGGNDSDGGNSLAVALDGSCYIIGSTLSTNFPTFNAFNSTKSGSDYEIFIAKFSSNGTLLWSTYFGGNYWNIGRSIAVSSDGSCYITGWTYSTNFPTLNAYNSTYGGLGDAFVAKFSSTGTLLWSTFLGGNHMDAGMDIAVFNDGICYVTGFTLSNNFPILNAYDDTHNGYDVFITKFSASGALLWSTFLGGSSMEEGFGITIATDGSCFAIGRTVSQNFPITINAYDNSYNGGEYDAFVTRFSASGALLWSTYLGGTLYDTANDIAVADDGSCFITGYTKSNDFPIMKAYDKTINGNLTDAFVVKFSNSGSLIWSTFLGGNSDDYGGCIALTNDGSCYVTGASSSSDFPTNNAYDSTLNGGSDAFITKFSEGKISPYYSFLSIIIVIPILVVVLRKRKK